MSLTAGTLFTEANLPLRSWSLAVYLLTQCKNSISVMVLHQLLFEQLSRVVRHAQSPMRAMVKSDGDLALGGIVQLDDAYWVGPHHGGGVWAAAFQA